MKFDRSLLIPCLIAFAVLYALNFHCWQPGIGGRTDIQADGTRPAGSELEIYLGFPACYRAELWRSYKQGLTMQQFRTAPFSQAVARHTSASAKLSNLLFATAAFSVVILVFTEDRHHWNRRAKFIALGCAVIGIACYLMADRVSAHL